MTDHDTKIVVFTGFLSVVPARAGVILIVVTTLLKPFCGPRASGGDPVAFGEDNAPIRWSPRERG